MNHFYYIIGVVIFISSLLSLLRFNKLYKIKEWYSKFKIITGEEPTSIDFRKRGDRKIYANHNFLLRFELIWILLGLFTIDRYVFLIILLTNIFINVLFKNKFTTPYKIVSFIFLLSRVSLYLFLIVNHFIK